MKREVVYFEKAGRDNTEKCVEIVNNIIEKDGYRNLVVASTTGETGLKFAEKLGKKLNLVVVTHNCGFSEPNKTEIPDEVRNKIKGLGAKVFTGTILTSGLEKSFAENFGGTYPQQIVAESLRRLGEGVKVCVDIVVEATDAGMIPEGEDIIAVAGTSRGSDTVCIIKSATARRFLELKIREIVAKPRNF